MPTNRKPSTATDVDSKRHDDAPRKSTATQPAATGANRGSPAASVMKQFQKTRTESSGRT
jgi:hypothetical protein